MRWTIEQTDDGWVLSLNGEAIERGPFGTYDEALQHLAGALAAEDAPVETTADGLLPETWTSADGIAFSEALPGGRDFTNTSWSWRDPSVSTLPLMLQTSTDMGHFGAELAGFIETLSETGGTISAAGRFYDSEIGRQARDLLLGGRTFGVSVDPTEAVEVEYVCDEYDEDGWCMSSTVQFLAYEIGGLTMTPFPAFERAAIQLAGTSSDAADAPAQDAEPVAAAAGTATLVRPSAPPAAWFEVNEQDVADLAVEQPDGSLAVPLTITDEGQVFGNLAVWGQCHVGYQDACVSPPTSLAAYAHFHVGAVRTAENTTVPTGTLTIGCEHAPHEMNAWQARDHYAHSGHGWANVRASNGDFGPWVCGALRPDVTDEQVTILRSLTLSGDWRAAGGGLELIGGLAVNTPGFPIAREALVASGLDLPSTTPMVGARIVGRGDVTVLTAAGLVHRCAECAKRARDGGQLLVATPDRRIDRLMTMVESIERRTRHLIPQEMAAQRDAMIASGLLEQPS